MKNNRIFALLLALILVLSIAMPAFATGTEEETAATEATEATEVTEIFETIYIKDAEDLLELAENCRLDTWSVGKLVKQYLDDAEVSHQFNPKIAYDVLYAVFVN